MPLPPYWAFVRMLVVGPSACSHACEVLTIFIPQGSRLPGCERMCAAWKLERWAALEAHAPAPLLVPAPADVKLFEDQGNSDAILDDLACMLGCTRSSLHGGCEQTLQAGARGGGGRRRGASKGRREARCALGHRKAYPVAGSHVPRLSGCAPAGSAFRLCIPSADIDGQWAVKTLTAPGCSSHGVRDATPDHSLHLSSCS